MLEQKKLRVLILGANGMLGSTIFRELSCDNDIVTFGTLRAAANARYFLPELRDALIPDIHIDNESNLLKLFTFVKPDIVINCVGIIKQLPNAKNHLDSLSINSVLPHRLAKYCNMLGARLIHFSTDCVFSGDRGNYTETDFPDAADLYGRTKYLGEVDYENTLTLRTSIIGHELGSAQSLIDWFLSQTSEVNGYEKAIFSGLPTIEVARVIRDMVLPNSKLKGLYHLSVDPINKYDLLSLVAKTYGKKIGIVPDKEVVIDRSLNSDRFRAEARYSPKPWPALVQAMHEDYQSYRKAQQK